MRKEVLVILRKTYLEYGNEVFCDKNRLNAFLEDLLYEFPVERRKISLAVNENIAYRIINDVTSKDLTRIGIFIEDLVECYELPRNVATDIVNALSYSITGRKYHPKNVGIILRELYYSPDDAIEKEYADEIYYAAENGNPDAQYRVGRWFETGIIVEKSLFMAKTWYMKAAQKNHCWAIHNLGHIYELEGAIQEAIKCYRLSLELGEILSAYNIAIYYKNDASNKSAYEKIESLTLAIKYLRKGTDLTKPKYDSSYQVFLKTKYECAKKAAFICKEIFDVVFENRSLEKNFDMKGNIETSKYFTKIQEETANIMKDMYNLRIEKIKW